MSERTTTIDNLILTLQQYTQDELHDQKKYADMADYMANMSTALSRVSPSLSQTLGGMAAAFREISTQEGRHRAREEKMLEALRSMR